MVQKVRNDAGDGLARVRQYLAVQSAERGGENPPASALQVLPGHPLADPRSRSRRIHTIKSQLISLSLSLSLSHKYQDVNRQGHCIGDIRIHQKNTRQTLARSSL